MTETTVALLGVIVTLLLALMAFIWNASATATEHKMRITFIENAHTALMETIENLTRAVNRLDKREAVNRASQGQYADSDSPPRERT